MQSLIIKIWANLATLLEAPAISLGSSVRGLVAFNLGVLGFLLGYSSEVIKLMVAQSAIETSWWNSDKNPMASANKNAFGMRQPSVRQTTAIGSNLGHAVYRSYAMSVADRFYYDLHWGTDKTNVLTYIGSLVKQGYATAGGYAKLLKDILQFSQPRIDDVYNEATKTAVIYGSLGVAPFIIYKIFK